MAYATVNSDPFGLMNMLPGQAHETIEEVVRLAPPIETEKTKSLPDDLKKIAQEMIDKKFKLTKREKLVVPRQQDTFLSGPTMRRIRVEFRPRFDQYNPYARVDQMPPQPYYMEFAVMEGVAMDQERYQIERKRHELEMQYGMPFEYRLLS